MKREVRLNQKVIGVLDDKSNNLAYFYSSTPESPFSNMYQSPNGFDLYYKNGQMSANKSKNAKVYHFNCVEQVFSFGKVLAMHDKERAKKIYQTKTCPADYNKLGRSVKTFDGQKLNQKASNWMKLGLVKIHLLKRL